MATTQEASVPTALAISVKAHAVFAYTKAAPTATAPATTVAAMAAAATPTTVGQPSRRKLLKHLSTHPPHRSRRQVCGVSTPAVPARGAHQGTVNSSCGPQPLPAQDAECCFFDAPPSPAVSMVGQESSNQARPPARKNRPVQPGHECVLDHPKEFAGLPPGPRGGTRQHKDPRCLRLRLNTANLHPAGPGH